MDKRALKIHRKKLKRANKKYHNPIRLSTQLNSMLLLGHYDKYMKTCAENGMV